MADERPVIVGVFADRTAAERAVSELEQAGFDDSQIGFAIRGAEAVRGGMITDAVGTKDSKGAVTGMVTGGITGGLLAAAASLLIPGVGPILAGGILATAFGFGAAGAAIGGILGAMTGLGISEEEAQFYDQEFRSGKAIVTVRAPNRVGDAAAILKRHGGYDIHAARGNQSVPPPGTTT